MFVNTTINTPGRFANQFFRNLVSHFICKKNNLKFEYSHHDEFKKLGIEFFDSGTNSYNHTLHVTESNFLNLVKNPDIFHYNISFDMVSYFQTREFAFYIKDYIYSDDIKNKIIEKNLFKERYNNNNDVFIHIRLDDATHWNPGFIFYDSFLSNLEFDNGYISSDTIHHPMCLALIKKYNLQIINKNEVETIMFGSTCKNLLLSNGTFSWLIGLLGFFSKVYFPKIKQTWHGDVFVFNEWTELDTSNSVPPLPLEKALIMMNLYGIKDFD